MPPPPSSSSSSSPPVTVGFRIIVLIILGILALMMMYNVQSGLSSMDCRLTLLHDITESQMNAPLVSRPTIPPQLPLPLLLQQQPAGSLPPVFPLPRNTTESNLAIFVLSRRDAFEIRQSIRDTWAFGHDNVYFVIGQACSIPPKYRGVDEGGNSYCNVKKQVIHHADYVQATVEYAIQQDQVTQQLLREQDLYQDILLMQQTVHSTSLSLHSNVLIDMYRTLPHKLKTAYHFVYHHLPQIQWILKVDDDFYVRVANFEQRLRHTLPDEFLFHQEQAQLELQLQLLSGSKQATTTTAADEEEAAAAAAAAATAAAAAAVAATANKTMAPPHQWPVVISGDIRRSHTAFTSGKWKEVPQFPRGGLYPPFPLGSCGHVVSRPIMEYVAKYSMALLDYQGEDVSLGMWLDNLPFSHPQSSSLTNRDSNSTVLTTFIDWPEYMSNGGDCRKTYLDVIGHDVTPSKMKVCYQLDQENTNKKKRSQHMDQQKDEHKPQNQQDQHHPPPQINERRTNKERSNGTTKTRTTSTRNGVMARLKQERDRQSRQQ